MLLYSHPKVTFEQKYVHFPLKFSCYGHAHKLFILKAKWTEHVVRRIDTFNTCKVRAFNIFYTPCDEFCSLGGWCLVLTVCMSLAVWSPCVSLPYFAQDNTKQLHGQPGGHGAGRPGGAVAGRADRGLDHVHAGHHHHWFNQHAAQGRALHGHHSYRVRHYAGHHVRCEFIEILFEI